MSNTDTCNHRLSLSQRLLCHQNANMSHIATNSDMSVDALDFLYRRGIKKTYVARIDFTMWLGKEKVINFTNWVKHRSLHCGGFCLPFLLLTFRPHPKLLPDPCCYAVWETLWYCTPTIFALRAGLRGYLAILSPLWQTPQTYTRTTYTRTLCSLM